MNCKPVWRFVWKGARERVMRVPDRHMIFQVRWTINHRIHPEPTEVRHAVEMEMATVGGPTQ